jgi:FixJ family two-component response regulator
MGIFSRAICLGEAVSGAPIPQTRGCVLADLVMPEMSGLQLLSEMEKLRNFSLQRSLGRGA